MEITTGTSKMTEKALNIILDWALTENKVEIVKATLNTIKSEKSIGLFNCVDARSSLFEFRYSINKLTSGNEKGFQDALISFLDLKEKYLDSSIRGGIPKKTWQEFQRSIVFWIGMAILYSYASVDKNENFQDEDNINTNLDAIDFEKYKEDIKKLFEDCESLYREDECDKNSPIFHIYKIHQEYLLEKIYKAAGSTRRKKVTKASVVAIFSKFNFKIFKNDLIQFMERVENLIFHEPTLNHADSPRGIRSFRNTPISQRKDRSELQQRDWSDQQKDNSGPYQDNDDNDDDVEEPRSTLAEVIGKFNGKYNELDPLSKSLGKRGSENPTNGSQSLPGSARKRAASPIQSIQSQKIRRRTEPYNRKIMGSRPNAQRSKIDFSDEEEVEEEQDEIPARGSTNKRTPEREHLAPILGDENEEIESVASQNEQKGSVASPSRAMVTMRAITQVRQQEEDDFPVQLSPAVSMLSNQPRPAIIRNKKIWSAIETKAVMDGVADFGPGNWMLIKDDPRFRNALKDRTGVQIKDKYRTLNRRGLI